MVVVVALTPGVMGIVVAHLLHWVELSAVRVLRDRMAGVEVKSLRFPTASSSLEEHREVALGWIYTGQSKVFPELSFYIETY